MSTVVAVQADPHVVCPSWCTTPQADHVADLPDWEGFVVHQGSVAVVAGREVSLSSSAFVDGTFDPDDGPMVWIDGRNMTPSQARALAMALTHAADAVGGQQ